MSRRVLKSFLALVLILFLGWSIPPAIAAETAPESPASAATLFEKLSTLREQAFEATNKGNFSAAEEYWTELIKLMPENPALWSNRGNAKVSQNKLEDAIADFNKAIALEPQAPDPYLNRGTALEGLGKWNEAIADYNHVLELDPQDAAAYNNRGNAKAGLGQWEAALTDYQKAADMARDYAFARANAAIAQYELGQTDDAIRTMKALVRKYPKFADMRAALTAALWVEGKQGEAESQWVSAIGLDRRYKDLEWVKNVRRWSPKLVTALDKFLSLKS